MITTKKLSLILLIAAIAVISGCVRSLPKNQGNNGQVKNATTTEVNNATSTEPVVVATSTVENIDTKGWKTYKNIEYGYTLMYPKNWKVNDVNYYEKDFEIGIKYVAFTDNNYYLVFLLNKVNENFNYGRTGISAGDFIKAGEIKVGGINVTINNLVYDGKTREIFFSGRNEFYNIAGYFSYLGDNYNANFNFNTDKFKIAQEVMKSLKFIKPTVAEINTNDWKLYRNNEYGFEVKYPKGWDLREGSRIQLGNEQNYVMISNAAEKSYLIIDKIDNEKIIIDKNMNVKMLDNITIGGYMTEIAYIENGLNQDLFYRYFLRTTKENLQIYFVPGENTETNKSIFYHIINTIKFD